MFIDRDGILIKEAPPTYQVDSWDKLEFYPEVFFYMKKIADDFGYALVMVTNQDGLGTDSFPEENFWPIHRHVIKSFENEGVSFHATYIDRSFPQDNSPNRKPGIGMLKEYLNSPGYDLANSFVIGDRITDVQLAKNLGCKAIWLNNNPTLGSGEIKEGIRELKEAIALETHSWEKIYEFLKLGLRKAVQERNTNETKIKIELNLDGTGNATIKTGLGFFDHMLEQIARHGNFDLSISVTGDLHIDEHHTIEDVGLVLGDAFLQA